MPPPTATDAASGRTSGEAGAGDEGADDGSEFVLRLEACDFSWRECNCVGGGGGDSNDGVTMASSSEHELNDDQRCAAALSSAALTGISFTVKRGEMIVVWGPTGCGKSTLLASVLGELECTSGAMVKGRFGSSGGAASGLERGAVAVSMQQAWIMAGSVRSNITFGKRFEKLWYAKVTRACALETDFAQLPKGDQTYIGDNGVNLSGGQKARVSLARAVYARPTLALLDDTLSAVGECSFVYRYILRESHSQFDIIAFRRRPPRGATTTSVCHRRLAVERVSQRGASRDASPRRAAARERDHRARAGPLFISCCFAIAVFCLLTYSFVAHLERYSSCSGRAVRSGRVARSPSSNLQASSILSSLKARARDGRRRETGRVRARAREMARARAVESCFRKRAAWKRYQAPAAAAAAAEAAPMPLLPMALPAGAKTAVRVVTRAVARPEVCISSRRRSPSWVMRSRQDKTRQDKPKELSSSSRRRSPS